MSRRQKMAAARRAQFWSGRITACTRPDDRASVAWDWLRSTIADLPANEWASAWKTVADRIDALRAMFTEGEVHSSQLAPDPRTAGLNGQPRAGAHEAILTGGHAPSQP